MFNLPNNIDKNGRVVRGVIGGLLIVGGIAGFGPVFMFILGIILIAEATVSYCVIIDGMNRFNPKKSPAPSGTSTVSSTTPPASNPGSSSNSSSTTPPSDNEPKA